MASGIRFERLCRPCFSAKKFGHISVSGQLLVSQSWCFLWLSGDGSFICLSPVGVSIFLPRDLFLHCNVTSWCPGLVRWILQPTIGLIELCCLLVPVAGSVACLLWYVLNAGEQVRYSRDYRNEYFSVVRLVGSHFCDAIRGHIASSESPVWFVQNVNLWTRSGTSAYKDEIVV